MLAKLSPYTRSIICRERTENLLLYHQIESPYVIMAIAVSNQIFKPDFSERWKYENSLAFPSSNLFSPDL